MLPLKLGLNKLFSDAKIGEREKRHVMVCLELFDQDPNI